MRTITITIDEQLYRTLKKIAGPRAMSRFIAEALKEKLEPAQGRSYQEYELASRDKERNKVLASWNVIETEGWR